PVVSTAQKHSGSYSALLGSTTTPEPNGDSSIQQTIAVPSGGGTLRFWYWPSTTDTITYDWQEAQIRNTSGTVLAQVFKVASNAPPEPTGDSSIQQTITVPASGATLSFWYWPATTDTITYDWQEAQIRNTSGTVLAQVFKVASNAQAWTQVTYSLSAYAGQTI